MMRGRSEVGFTWVEAGILVSVVATLVVVLVFGKAFLEPGHVGQLIDRLDSVQGAVVQYAAANKGVIPPTNRRSLFEELKAAGLLSPDSLASVADFKIDPPQRVNSHSYSVTVHCPDSETCQQIAAAKSRDEKWVGFPAPIPVTNPLTVVFDL